ncbi:MAG: hypothetical protein SFY67_15240 [Candidatus Melainabacteria bacterium]|nr:hypothetical protein [Candidatus Melainabacteria bacterium]
MSYLEESMECPHCAEIIRRNALACRFCNYGLSDEHYRNCAACDERIRIQAKLCRFCGTFGQNTTAAKKIHRIKFPEPAPSGVYGTSIKQQVFEVIVRQAMAGAPWRDICKGPMIANGIDPKEIEEELRHRQTGNFAPHHNNDIDDDSKKNDVEFPYDSADDNLDALVKIEPDEEKHKKKSKVKDKDKSKNKDKKKGK